MGLSGTFDAYNFRNLDTAAMPPFANLEDYFGDSKIKELFKLNKDITYH